MARLLIGRDRQRERALQESIQNRLAASFRRGMQAELRRAMGEMAQQFAALGTVPVIDDHAKRVEALLLRDYSSAIEWSAGRIMEAVGKSARGPGVRKAEGPDLFDRLTQEYMAAWGGLKITEITETTRAQIMQVVETARTEGLGQAEIAKRIAQRAPVIARWRSEIIARTETHGASNFAAQGAAEETGLPLRKEWVAVQDDRTRDAHSDVNGQVVNLPNSFDVMGDSLAYPGDPSGQPSNVINCRCAAVHIVDD